MNFNEVEFKEKLLSATKNAFEKVLSVTGAEELYCFSLFTEGLFGYFAPTAMTTEGLERTLQGYRDRGSCASQTDGELRLSLKWSPCDSPYHMLGDEFFVEVNEISSKMSEEFFNLEDDEFGEFQSKIISIVTDVLKEIYFDKKFRDRYDPDKLFFSLMMGDQDDSVLEIGKEVNRHSTYSQFESDWEKMISLWS